jgi:CelD/BcsL family acetyltransferase involved in cellulose biosynthesis
VHGTIESLFRVEWRPLAELAPIMPQWQSLAGRALAPNVFYEPAFALAAAPVFGRDAGAGLVWSRTAPARLVGLFPATIERRRYGVPLPVLVGWTHRYAPLGAPLIDQEAGETVIDAWLGHLAADAPLPNLMLLPYLPAEGPLARALDAALARHGGRSKLFDRHARAELAPGGDRNGYIEHAVGKKKLKELRRQLRRLGKDGAVTSTVATEPKALASWLGDFLALEASGWKGRAGTAARNHADIRSFIETAVVALAAEGKAHVARLCLDGRAVAAMIVLQSKDTAWAWKIAYDETAARASPGVQLLLDVTKVLLDDPKIARADSCATANHPMIDHVWRERLVLADRLIQVGRGSSAAFALASAGETLRRGTIATAKCARDLLRR